MKKSAFIPVDKIANGQFDPYGRNAVPDAFKAIAVAFGAVGVNPSVDTIHYKYFARMLENGYSARERMSDGEHMLLDTLSGRFSTIFDHVALFMRKNGSVFAISLPYWNDITQDELDKTFEDFNAELGGGFAAKLLPERYKYRTNGSACLLIEAV